MKLNDDAQAMLAGRKIQVGTANSQNRSNSRGSQYNNNNNDNRGSFDNGNYRHSHPQSGGKNDNTYVEIDGSKFRGGKYSNYNDNNSNNINNSNNSHRNNSFRNHTNHDDRQSNLRERESFAHKKNDVNTNKDTPSAPPTRPSLKLAPRSKPVDGTELRASSSGIFGGAKARDEQTWEKNRRTSQQQEQTKVVKDQTVTDTTNSKDLENEKAKKDKQLSDVIDGGDNSNTTENNAVNKKNEKKADVWASVEPGTTNKKKGNKLSSAHQLERRQSSRGEGRGGKNRGARGSNSGQVNHEKDDHNNRNHKRGSGRRQSQQQQQQQHKKQDKRRQQPSPEEKAAAAADKTKNLTSKNSGTANMVPQLPSKKEIKTPSNTFSLLMDSDSE